MIRWLKYYLKSLLAEQPDFREQLIRIAFLMAFVGAVTGMGRVLLGAEPEVLYALMPLCIVSALSLHIAAWQRKVRLASWLLVLTSNLILFPMIFVMSSGMDSGTPVWFVLGLVYVFLLFRGRDFWITLLLTLGAYLGIYLLTYFRPGIMPPAERSYSFADSYVTLICVSCFIGVMLKIQSKTYEREKRLAEKQKEEIERIARSKDAFFANMSHEIRTPVNTIIGLNEMILREDISDEIAENAINIQNAGKMLLTTINDILDLSKLESGKLEIMPRQYEISTMFSDLVNLIWIRAHQKNLEFKVDIDPGIPSMLYGDEMRIKQVVSNMLTNAVKYTEAGAVTLIAKSERVAPDVILLRISVEDTGKGIRKDSLSDLFSSFKRVDETENRNIEGTGLGLTISRQLMEMMGGTISVDSVYHRGSVFTIELRQKIVNSRPIGVINFAAQKQPGQRKKYKQSFTAPDARVLVVDDNTMNLMVAVKLLRDTKVKVDTAESGRECLKKTGEYFYHAILMDHMMPEMDGEAAMKAVRAQTRGYCQKTPVIALTANVMSNAEQEYQKMGFDGYLAKPVNGALLEASLLKYLPRELIEFTAEEDSVKEGETAEINQINSARKRKIAVTAECICDLPQELLDRYQISLMHTYVHTKEGRFCDLSEISSDSLMTYLQTKGNYALSSTAEPAEYEYFFANVLARAEQVIHITATADLSGACSNATQASRSFGNVTVVDSCHISSGHGLMVLHAAALAEQGRSVEEICKALGKFRNQVVSGFLAPGTEMLARNGRVSGMMNRFCTALNLYPVLAMSKNKLKLWKIETGNVRQVSRRYVRKLFRHPKQIDSRILFLTCAGCPSGLMDEVLEEVGRHIRFERIILQKASAAVTVNCGTGTFGLMFLRREDSAARPLPYLLQ